MPQPAASAPFDRSSSEPVPGRPDWLDDALDRKRGPLSASTWAWEHRWLPIPVDFGALEELAGTNDLTASELHHLALIAARRVHFAFAFETLARLCRDALARFPEDELLTVLRAAADVALGRASWEQLEAWVAALPAEGIAVHVLLTSIYLSEDVPEDVLQRALASADRLAADGDLIARYRTVSILRRLGRYEESLRAGMLVNEELASGRHPGELCDHLSERVLTERHLAVELLGLRERQDTRDAAGRLWNTGL